jgi:hypothetical protein
MKGETPRVFPSFFAFRFFKRRFQNKTRFSYRFGSNQAETGRHFKYFLSKLRENLLSYNLSYRLDLRNCRESFGKLFI